MRVLVACEFSGIVRDEFKRLGHDALSVDLLPSERPGRHVIADIRDIVSDHWDLMVAFPPCTYLASSGARWHWTGDVQDKALELVQFLMDAPIEKIAIGNPVGAISTRIRKPDQIIQPWQFAHPETKATCLWLKGLPRLSPVRIVTPTETRIHKMPDTKDRWRNRSRTYPGIARAMAWQWTYAP